MSGAGQITSGGGFTPATSIKDAENWLKESLSGGKSYATNDPRYKIKKTISDKLDDINLIGYKKLSLDEANAFNKVFSEVNLLCDKLDIPRIRAIDFTANSASMGDGVLRYGRYGAKNLTSNKVLEKSRVSKWKVGDSLKLKPYSSHEYYKTTATREEGTIWHEIGHHIHQQYKVTDKASYNYPHIEKQLNKILKTKSSRVDSPSKYGLTNNNEFFAENFELYVKGKRKMLRPNVIEFMDSIFEGDF